jgi:hypothetical protein
LCLLPGWLFFNAAAGAVCEPVIGELEKGRSRLPGGTVLEVPLR